MPAKPRKVKFNPKKHKKWDPEKHLDRRKKQSGELYGGFLKVSMNELAEMKQPLPEVERPSGFRKIGDQYKYKKK